MERDNKLDREEDDILDHGCRNMVIFALIVVLIIGVIIYFYGGK